MDSSDVQRRLLELPKNILASGIAWSWGAMAFNNLDVLRVRWQVTPGAVKLHGGSVRSFTGQIVAQEGFLRGLCLPGVTANVAFCTMNGAVRVGTYPVIRDAITPFVGRGAADAPQTMLAAGLLSGAVGYFIPTPFQLLKVRLQGIDAGLVCSTTGRLTTGARAGEMPLYRSLRVGLHRVYEKEGVKGLWRGGSALTFRGSLHSAGHLCGYDTTKTEMKRRGIMDDGPALHVLASIVGAFWAVTLSVGPDNVMSRFMTASDLGVAYSGPLECARKLIASEGVGVLGRGWTPFFIRMAPIFTVQMTIYEQCRRLLGLSYME